MRAHYVHVCKVCKSSRKTVLISFDSVSADPFWLRTFVMYDDQPFVFSKSVNINMSKIKNNRTFTITFYRHLRKKNGITFILYS